MTTVASARRYAAALLTASGVPEEYAATTARLLVLAEAWGTRSHGLLRLPHYLRRIAAGGIAADAQLHPVRAAGAVATFDGRAGLGHWQVWQAATLGAELCAAHGLSAVAVGNSSHCGALGAYTVPALERGYVALVFSDGPAVMPPWGGTRPLLSTSPIAAGVPCRPRPAIVDLATTAVARGRIAEHAARGEPLPAGWAFDATGTPTLDPAAALRGMLAPLGGAKGFALALLVEALTGAAVGPELSAGVPDMFDADADARPQRIAHLVITLDPALLDIDGHSPERLAALAEAVSATGGRVPGSGRRLPDEIPDDEQLTVLPTTAAELRSWATRLGVPT
jgi:(2R)-3-sulfolactate dehydrogenase (NADP+)